MVRPRHDTLLRNRRATGRPIACANNRKPPYVDGVSVTSRRPALEVRAAREARRIPHIRKRPINFRDGQSVMKRNTPPNTPENGRERGRLAGTALAIPGESVCPRNV
jgi:hypothetical protein